MQKLTNKTVFITGASSGIGAACAIDCAKLGANILVCARRLDKLNEVKTKIESLGVKCFAFELDVKNKSSVEKSISNLPSEWKNIDILINNAGLARGVGKFQDGKIEDWEEMIDTNFKGLLYVTKAVLPQMLAKNLGHIVNIGSIAGVETYPGGNVYSASKAAISMLSKALKMDLHGTKVRISQIDPGRVETEFNLVRNRGDQKANTIYQEITPLSAQDIAEIVSFCITRPVHVNINEVLVLPTDQASTWMWAKKAS